MLRAPAPELLPPRMQEQNQLSGGMFPPHEVWELEEKSRNCCAGTRVNEVRHTLRVQNGRECQKTGIKLNYILVQYFFK